MKRFWKIYLLQDFTQNLFLLNSNFRAGLFSGDIIFKTYPMRSKHKKLNELYGKFAPKLKNMNEKLTFTTKQNLLKLYKNFKRNLRPQQSNENYYKPIRKAQSIINIGKTFEKKPIRKNNKIIDSTFETKQSLRKKPFKAKYLDHLKGNELQLQNLKKIFIFKNKGQNKIKLIHGK